MERIQKDYENTAKELVQLCREAGQEVPEEEDEDWNENMGDEGREQAGQNGQDDSEEDGSESEEDSEDDEDGNGGIGESKGKKRKTADCGSGTGPPTSGPVLALADAGPSVKARAALLEKGTAQTRTERSRTPVKN